MSSSRRLLLPALALTAAIGLAAAAFLGGDEPALVDAADPAVATPADTPPAGDSTPATEAAAVPDDRPSRERMTPLRVDQPGMTIGDPGAPLVMVAFESFGCLWCGNFHRLTMPGVMTDWVDTGLLRIETRMLPYEDRAVPGARIGMAAGLQDRYWPLAEHLYPFISGGGEPPVGRDLTEAELGAYRERQTEEALLAQVEGVADEIDLDWDRFLADYASAEVATLVQRDQQLAYQLGFTGTPAMVVNGVPMGGYASPERFHEFLTGVHDATMG